MSLISCSNLKVGDATVTISPVESEILIDNFPRYRQGISGFNAIDWPEDFSFNKLDKIVFNALKGQRFGKSNVNVFIRFIDKDQYGKSNPKDWVFIGQLSVDEAKKYEDFTHWNNRYKISEMFWKTDRKNGK